MSDFEFEVYKTRVYQLAEAAWIAPRSITWEFMAMAWYEGWSPIKCCLTFSEQVAVVQGQRAR